MNFTFYCHIALYIVATLIIKIFLNLLIFYKNRVIMTKITIKEDAYEQR